MTQHLGAFFDRCVFAEDATYSPQTGNKVALKAVFTAESQMQEELAIRYQGSRPTALCREDKVGAAKIGDGLNIRGTDLYVIGVEPSGTGTVLLVLSRDDPR